MVSLVKYQSRHLANEMSDRPYRTGVKVSGWVLLALALVGAVWLWPELMRYLRVRQM